MAVLQFQPISYESGLTFARSPLIYRFSGCTSTYNYVADVYLTGYTQAQDISGITNLTTIYTSLTKKVDTDNAITIDVSNLVANHIRNSITDSYQNVYASWYKVHLLEYSGDTLINTIISNVSLATLGYTTLGSDYGDYNSYSYTPGTNNVYYKPFNIALTGYSFLHSVGNGDTLYKTEQQKGLYYTTYNIDQSDSIFISDDYSFKYHQGQQDAYYIYNCGKDNSIFRPSSLNKYNNYLINKITLSNSSTSNTKYDSTPYSINFYNYQYKEMYYDLQLSGSPANGCFVFETGSTYSDLYVNNVDKYGNNVMKQLINFDISQYLYFYLVPEDPLLFCTIKSIVYDVNMVHFIISSFSNDGITTGTTYILRSAADKRLILSASQPSLSLNIIINPCNDNVVPIKFMNKFGVWEFIQLNGRRDIETNSNYELYKYNNVNYNDFTTDGRSYHKSFITAKNKFTANTGWLKESQNTQLKELMLSEYVYFTNNYYYDTLYNFSYKYSGTTTNACLSGNYGYFNFTSNSSKTEYDFYLNTNDLTGHNRFIDIQYLTTDNYVFIIENNTVILKGELSNTPTLSTGCAYFKIKNVEFSFLPEPSLSGDSKTYTFNFAVKSVNSVDIPVNIVDKDIKYKTDKWDKLLNYTLTFEEAFDKINNII